MNKGLVAFISFTAGLAAGAGGAIYICKRSIQDRIDDEVFAVKEAYAEEIKSLREELSAIKHDVASESLNKPELPIKQDSVENIVEGLGYVSDTPTKPTTNKKPGRKKKNKLMLINDTAYATEMDYEKVRVLYFDNDDTFCTADDGEVFEGFTGLLAEGTFEHFSDYEPDILFLRNEQLGIDYEVTLHEGESYSDYYDEYYGDIED